MQKSKLITCVLVLILSLGPISGIAEGQSGTDDANEQPISMSCSGSTSLRFVKLGIKARLF